MSCKLSFRAYNEAVHDYAKTKKHFTLLYNEEKTVFIWTSWIHKWMHVPLIIPVVLFKPKKNLLDANMHVN